MTERQRIAIAVHVYPDGGGISAIVENYVAALRDLFEVHVIIVEARPGWEGLREAGARTHVIGLGRVINPVLFPTSVIHSVIVGRAMRKLIGQLRPDLLITQDALHLAVPSVIATQHRTTRLVLMDHGTLTNVYAPAWLPMLRRRLGGFKGILFTAAFKADTPWRALRWRIGVRAADQLWFTGVELAPWFGRAGSRARTYSQSVPEDFCPASGAERARAREALGLPADQVIINCVGRLDGEKGLDTIVTAVDDPSIRNVEFTLAIAGDGSLGEWLDREIRARGLGDRILGLGRLVRPDVVKLQQASDIHLYAGTFSCGVSICLLEAMAAGVAPVASDEPAAQRDLIGQDGWVFTAGDVHGLREALLGALRMPEADLRDLGRRACVRVHSQSDPTVPELIEQMVGR